MAIATGHAMLGLTLARVTGRIIAELIMGKPRALTRQLDPRRFKWAAVVRGCRKLKASFGNTLSRTRCLRTPPD